MNDGPDRARVKNEQADKKRWGMRLFPSFVAAEVEGGCSSLYFFFSFLFPLLFFSFSFSGRCWLRTRPVLMAMDGMGPRLCMYLAGHEIWRNYILGWSSRTQVAGVLMYA